MKVHPAIAALRGAPASQRRPSPSEEGSEAADNVAALKAAPDAWLARPATRAVADGLGRYGAGKPLKTCKALHSLIGNHRRAQAFVGSLLERILPALRERPLAEAPFRFKVSQGLATVQLMQSGGATLSLAAYEPLAGAETPQSALFSDREVHELVLRGEAYGAKHHWEGEGRLTTKQRLWRRGDRITLNAQSEARQILRVDRSLLLLQLTREPTRPAPTRLVLLKTGELMRTASGDKSASQAVMALGILGALGTTSPLGVMERTALHRAEDQDVRWEAVRQTLGLSTRCGMALLSELAERADDPLAIPARALKAQLLKAQPELRPLITEAIA